jgi:glutathione S-transferase
VGPIQAAPGSAVSDLILHHFNASPYAEKARLMLGIKQLAWGSVQIPMIMPKPDLVALTGGYRKTPVLQIGADVYCDTCCIARELERRHPAPTLFPDGGTGLAIALAAWGDRYFEPGAALAMTVNDDLPTELLRDRREFFTHMDFAALPTRVPQLYAQLLAHTALMEAQLADGRSFLQGPRAGLADITAYFVIFMVRGFLAEAGKLLAQFVRLQAWETRVRAIGHGQPVALDSVQALEVARGSRPAPGRGVDPSDRQGLQTGQLVTVTPSDYGKVPVTGTLVTLDLHEVAIRREDERAGEVVVHFPRIGYDVAPDG